MKRCTPWIGWAVVLLVQGACGGSETVDGANSPVGAQDDSGTVDGGSGANAEAGAALGAGGSGGRGLLSGRGGSAGAGASTGAGASSGTGASSGAGASTGAGASSGTGAASGAGGVANDGSAQTGSTGAGANGTSGSGHGSAVTGVLSVPAEQACTQESSSASLRQLDMLIVQDNTNSMDEKTEAGPTKWTMVTDALSVFVKDTRSTGMGAGIVFFSGSDVQACTAATYETPAVPIAKLPGNATAITNAIAANVGLSGTPTPEALKGALHYAANWATTYPQHKVVVVLATDGLPNKYTNASGTGCATSNDTALTRTLAAAKAGVDGSPSIATYVIGVMAPSDTASLANLNNIAQSGNTGAAFIVSTASNAAAQFVNAMNQIREANRVACDFAIPEPPTDKWIDFSQVSVVYNASDGGTTSVGWVSSSAGCTAAGGFYYDNNAAPTAVHLCPTTCTQVQADNSATVKVLFACMLPVEAGTVVNPATQDDGGSSTGAGGGSNGTGGSGGGTDLDSGVGGDASVAPACLLNGQSCQTDSACCLGFCNASGYCGLVIN